MTNHSSNAFQETGLEASYGMTKEVIYQIRKLMQAEELYTKELNKKHRVTAPQLHCLLALYENGPRPPSQIANHILVKPSTITGIIDRLEHKGLVERARISPDRRVITIDLTEEGRHLAEKVLPPIQKKIVDGLKKIPQAEIKQIVRSLTELTHMLDLQDLDVR